jgi:hypothetical protein
MSEPASLPSSPEQETGIWKGVVNSGDLEYFFEKELGKLVDGMSPAEALFRLRKVDEGMMAAQPTEMVEL